MEEEEDFEKIWTDMIYINDKPFYEKPGSCATCPFFFDGHSSMCYCDKGVCTLFGEQHKGIINPPARCQKLFNKAFKYAEGTRLVIMQSQ